MLKGILILMSIGILCIVTIIGVVDILRQINKIKENE